MVEQNQLGNKMDSAPGDKVAEGTISQGQALTGGKGNDVKQVVTERRTGQSSSTPVKRSGNKSADQPNRMVAENGVDLDAISDTGPTRQGNALGVQPDAAANFRDEANAKADDLERQVEDLRAEAVEWDKKAKGFN